MSEHRSIEQRTSVNGGRKSMSVHFNAAPSGMEVGTLEVLVNLETIQIADKDEGQHIVLDLDEARALLAFLKVVVPPESAF
jgi:hypothetical protein